MRLSRTLLFARMIRSREPVSRADGLDQPRGRSARTWDPGLSPVIWRVPPTSAPRSRIDCCGRISLVAQKIRAHGRNWDLSRSLLVSYRVQVEAVTADDAEWAARRWTPGKGLSLVDRLLMALGDRLDADIWTADQAWEPAGRYDRSARP